MNFMKTPGVTWDGVHKTTASTRLISPGNKQNKPVSGVVFMTSQKMI